MYLQGYDDPQLNGFFSKVFKKVFKPALHIGAAVFTGGASIPLSANYLAQKKAQEAQQKMLDDQARQEMALMAERERTALLPVSQAKLTPAKRSAVPAWVIPTVVAAGAAAATAVIISTASRR